MSDLLLFRIFKGNKVVAAGSRTPDKSLNILNCPVQSEILVLFQKGRIIFKDVSDIYIAYFEFTAIRKTFKREFRLIDLIFPMFF